MNFSKESAIKAGIFASVFFAGVITCKVTGGIRKSVRAHKAAKATRAATAKTTDSADTVVASS